MKKKFIIALHSTNNYWNYFNARSSGISTFHMQQKHFIGNNPNKATPFDTHQQAEDLIPYLGLGIFRIDTVYINDTI